MGDKGDGSDEGIDLLPDTRDAVTNRETFEIERRTAGDKITYEALDPQGESLGVLSGTEGGRGGLEVRSFRVGASARSEQVAHRLHEEAETQQDGLAYRWRDETRAEPPGQLDLLRRSRFDAVFPPDREGTDSGDGDRSEADEALRQRMDITSGEVASFLGVERIELADRTTLSDDDRFEAGLLEHADPGDGTSPDDVRGVLGVTYTREGRIDLRDGNETVRQGVDTHEALHAYAVEYRSARIPPPLDEGMTQHLTERIDPLAGRLTGFERNADGSTEMLVPGRDRPDGYVAGLDLHLSRAPEVYPEATQVARDLSHHIGEDTIKHYYVTGDDSGMRAELDASLGAGSWDRLLGLVDRSAPDWDAARRLLGEPEASIDR